LNGNLFVLFPGTLDLRIQSHLRLSHLRNDEHIEHKILLSWQEVVPLRKICRRPETEYRFQLAAAASAQVAATFPSLSESAPTSQPN
jgi:hypothetical protein